MANCRKSATKTYNNAAEWKEELEESAKQLKALKHDYENGLITQDEFQIHLGTEINESYEVNREFQEHVGTTAMCMRTFKELTDKLDSTRVVFLQKYE